MSHHPTPTTSARILGSPLSALLVLACWACVGPLAIAGEGPTPGLVLHLTNGGFVSGTIRDAEAPGTIRWQSPLFETPFDFAVDAINAVRSPAPGPPTPPRGTFRFDLAGGDVAFGDLVDLDETEAVVDLPRFGRLRFPRPQLRRIVRRGEGPDLVYSGPNGLLGWTPLPVDLPRAWRDDSGKPATDQQGASIVGDLHLPPRAAFEFELSWKNKPDFVLALGVEEGAKAPGRAFRIEAWDDELVALRETEQQADVAPLGPLKPGPGRVHLRVYLDQERGKLTAASLDGRTLAELQVAEPRPRAFPCVRLENRHGDVKLERLEVATWDGEPPRTPGGTHSPGEATLALDDGSSRTGRVVGYDDASKAFVIREGMDHSRIPLARVARATFSAPAGGPPPGSVRVAFDDGTRLTGALTRVDRGALWLGIHGGDEPFPLPLEGLRSLVVLRAEDAGPAGSRDLPRFEAEGVRLAGPGLVDGPGLAWRPDGSATAGRLLPASSGRVLYKEPPPEPTATPAAPPVAMRAGGVIQGVNGQFILNGSSVGSRRVVASSRLADPRRRFLYLRGGDVIPAEVVKIDEAGVTFRSPLSSIGFVTHDKVKAVELAAEKAITIRMSKDKRDRLLTLPRVQKGSPPTHLVRSTNGDYLRGRVVRMDGEALEVEVRLEPRSIPRDRVSRIIWFHPDETDPARAGAKVDDPPGASASTRVQAVRRDGIRLTFAPGRVEDMTLLGTSDVLGACRVRLGEVDQVLINGAIDQDLARLAYQRWRLTDAVEPKVAQDDGDPSPDGRDRGTDSPLVGKPAPDFELELLEGKPFRLANSKGSVVVLEFWATWCGPCLQAMPQVEKVTTELRDRGVRYVAVNLQETPKDVAAMLDRHKLKIDVALDREGVVAGKYGADAIPHTVVVGRDGSVVRVFVGSSPHLGDQLREALLPLLDAPDAKAPAR